MLTSLAKIVEFAAALLAVPVAYATQFGAQTRRIRSVSEAQKHLELTRDWRSLRELNGTLSERDQQKIDEELNYNFGESERSRVMHQQSR